MSRALPSFFCASSSFHPSDAIFFRGKQKRRDVSFLSEENRGALPPSIRKRSSGTGVSFSPFLQDLVFSLSFSSGWKKVGVWQEKKWDGIIFLFPLFGR
ncbi:hypothetical protein TNCV_1989241 [Trichonephila clavipes]|nr:hypothetical protein TNCV_1989241 [Trichonephila clavipes]